MDEELSEDIRHTFRAAAEQLDLNTGAAGKLGSYYKFLCKHVLLTQLQARLELLKGVTSALPQDGAQDRAWAYGSATESVLDHVS